MNILSKLSIKLKFSLALLMAVLLSSGIVGLISHNNATETMIENMEEKILPNILMRIRNQVDKEISLMLSTAEQLAEDPIVLDWLAAGKLQDNEALLVERLARINRQHGMSNVSFADRESYRYWNQDGFLRVLGGAPDQWFFDFVKSGKTDSMSLYTEDGTTKLFVNHQQLNGRGLSGLGKPVNDIVQLLNSNNIEQSGFVFLVDNAGLVKIHRDSSKLDKTDIKRLYGSDAHSRLISRQPFALFETEIDDTPMILASSYIASADWYVIAQVSEEEVLAKIETTANQTILTILIALLVMGAVGFVLAGSITRPIDSLAKEFTRLGQADGDLSVKLDTQQSPELERLGNGFNNFVAKIVATVNELAHVSETLREEAQTVLVSAEKVTQRRSNPGQPHHRIGNGHP